MPNDKPISLFKLILFGYYLPMVALCLIPTFQNGFFGVLLSLFAPFPLMVFGLYLATSYSFDMIWDLDVGYIISGVLFLAGLYFRSKIWGQAMVLLDLWGWTIVSGLIFLMQG